MKSVIMEINGKFAVAMSMDGNIRRIRNAGYTVGQRLDNDLSPSAHFIRRHVGSFATAAAALVLVLGCAVYAIPYSEISIDVNPSIELKMNLFDRVVSAKAMNGDADRILEHLRLFNCDPETASNLILTEFASQGYISTDSDADILLTTYSKDQVRAQDMLRVMLATMEQTTLRLQIRLNIQCECVGDQLQMRARQYNTTPGKLKLVEQYAQSTGDPDSVDVISWLTHSVAQIKTAISANNVDPGAGWISVGNSSGNGYIGGDKSGNGYEGNTSPGDISGSSDSGYYGGDQSGNGYGGNTSPGDSSGSSDTGYSGGNQSSNGYGGNTSPGDSSGSSDTGYSGGDQSNNGYGGNGSPSQSATPAGSGNQGPSGNGGNIVPSSSEIPAGSGNPGPSGNGR